MIPVTLHLAPGERKPELGIQSHRRSHLSDIATMNVLEHQDRWLWKNHPKLWRPRTVMVGRYGYDEHQEEEFRAGKKPKDCEFTLVLKDIGLADHPAIKALKEYILLVDTGGEAKGLFKFGRVVELLYDVYPSLEWWRVRQFAELVIEASIRVGLRMANGETLQPPSQKFISDVIASAYVLVEREFTADELTRVEPVVRRWVQGTPSFKPFDLPYCIQLLYWDFQRLPQPLRITSRRWLVAWCADAMRAELVRQRQFITARLEFDADLEAPRNRKTTELVFDHRGNIALSLFIRTDNPVYHLFVFHDTEAAIAVVIRRNTRHVQIFRRRHGGRTVSLQFTVALLRAKEQEKRGYPISAWRDLIAPEGPKGGECWFYHPQIGCILNRFPESEPTLLLDGEIQECLTQGLSDEFIAFRDEFRRARAAA